MAILDCLHLKLTESLYRTLENLTHVPHRITLTVQHEPELCIATTNLERRFQLEEEKNLPRYFYAASLEKSYGSFLGPIHGRFRTIADEESFQNAREGLVKDVEQSRTLKLQTLKVQADSASVLKKERLTNRRKNVKSASSTRKRPSPTKPTFLEPSSLIKSGQPRKKRTSVQSLHADKPVTATQEHRTQLTTIPVSFPPSVGQTVQTEACPLNSGHVVLEPSACIKELSRRRSSACSRRRALEARLMAALLESDEKTKKDLISAIRLDLQQLVEDLRNDDLLSHFFPQDSPM